MNRSFLVGLLLAGSTLWATAPVRGDQDILRLVPESAWAVVVCHRPAVIDGKFQGLCRLMQYPSVSPLLLVKQQLGIQEGVDENGTLAVVALPAPGGAGQPTAVLLVPVTDYGLLLRQLKAEDRGPDPVKVEMWPSSLWVRKVGGYAALGFTLESVAGLSPTAAVPRALEPWRDWLSEGDVSAVILTPGIKQVSAVLQAEIAKTRAALPQADKQTRSAGAVMEAYGELLTAAAGQVSACGFSVRGSEEEGLRVVGRFQLVPGGRLDRLVGQVHPLRGNVLQGLPSGALVMAGSVSASEDAFAAVNRYALDFMKRLRDVYGLSAEQIDKLGAATKRSNMGVEGMSMVLSADGDSMFSGWAGVLRVDDSAKWLQRYEKYVEEYNEALRGAESRMLHTIKLDKAMVAGAAALRLTMAAPEEMPGLETPGFDRAMEVFFGPEKKLTAWMVPVGPRSVVFSYMNKDRLERMVEEFRRGAPGLAEDAQIAKTARLLPSDAFAVGYVSVPGMLNLVARMTTAVAPPGAKAPELEALRQFPPTPPVGISLSAGPHELRISLAIPRELLKALGQYIQRGMDGTAPEKLQPRKVPGSSLPRAEAEPRARTSAERRPMSLDLSAYCPGKRFSRQALESFAGRQVIDGLPFDVRCQVFLYGKTPGERGTVYPEMLKGIRVGRMFDELHLIHHSNWPGVAGDAVAYIELNYAGGGKAIVPIRYGWQILDWFYLPSYEQETPTDPDTKVCWRHAPVQYKAPLRLFKSVLRNPAPEKVVETIDVISARGPASYGLLAATVANRDPARKATPPVRAAARARKFDSQLVIRVVDDASGAPIAEALVEPGMVAEGEGVVAEPMLTSAAGIVKIRYPRKETTEIWTCVKRDGYRSESRSWKAGGIPDAITVRLKRS